MKITITGGSGLVGKLVIQKLLSEKHSINVVTRSDKISIKNVNMVVGNTAQNGQWIDEIKDSDVFINLTGENIFSKRWTKNRKKMLLDSRIETTKNLVNIINSVTKDQTLISMSGADYYPSTSNVIYNENHDAGTTFLSNLCVQWEEPLKDLSNNNRGVVLRMGASIGPSGKGAERVFFTHKFFIGGWIGSGKQIIPWLHIDDFVNIICWSASTAGISGTYNCVAPEYITLKNLAKIGGKLLGRWTWTFIPGVVLKLLLGERAEMLLGGRKVSSEKLREAGYKFLFPTVEECLKDVFTKSKYFKLQNSDFHTV